MLTDTLFEIGAIKFGSFTWVSGIEAPYYIDLRIVPSYPAAFSTLVSELSSLVKAIPNYQNSTLAGVPTAGISFATAVARELSLPLVYIRKEEKAHGTKKLVEGVLNPETEVIIIEDLVSKGGSILKAAKALRESGALVSHAVATLDHGVGGKKSLEAENITLHTATTTLKAAEHLNKAGNLSDSQLKTVKEFVDAQS